MATDAGVDVQALDALPDPEILTSGNTTAAYSVARRWTTSPGALADIGETEQYESIDVYDWLGQRTDLNDDTVLRDLEAQAQQAALDDPYCDSIDVSASYNGGTLTLTGNGTGALGPFALVLSVDGLTASLLLPGQTQ